MIELTSLGKAWMGQPAKNGDLYAAGTSGETLDGYFGILIVWILLVQEHRSEPAKKIYIYIFFLLAGYLRFAIGKWRSQHDKT